MTDQAPITPINVNRNLMPMVTASTVTLAGAAVTIFSYIMHVSFGVGWPDEVEKALLVIVEAVFAFAAHRLTN